jgi:hypothetical protein
MGGAVHDGAHNVAEGIHNAVTGAAHKAGDAASNVIHHGEHVSGQAGGTVGTPTDQPTRRMSSDHNDDGEVV